MTAIVALPGGPGGFALVARGPGGFVLVARGPAGVPVPATPRCDAPARASVLRARAFEPMLP